MKKGIILLLCLYIGLNSNAQAVFHKTLTLKEYNYKTAAGKSEIYNFSIPELKAFIFYNDRTEAFAEVMYNGATFAFNNASISIFPVYFSMQTTIPLGKKFQSKIATRLYSIPDRSDFKDFNLKETDFPIMVVYNEKNELCGFTKTTEQISNIDCGAEQIDSKFLRLKILIDEASDGTKPYAFKPVVVLGGDKLDTLVKTTTNQYGDFDALLPNLNQDYLITINEKNPNINFVVLSTQTGQKIGNFKSIEHGYQYRILKFDLSKLPDILVEEDISLQLKPLDKPETKNFIITENLFYELGESKLVQSDKELLNKMIIVLQNYAQYNILITSHTDSQGDEATNLKLSIKRAETVLNYLISKGISKDRLKSEGKGETQIRNRCINNVNCSDKEHEYNRRTEFKFTRK